MTYLYDLIEPCGSRLDSSMTSWPQAPGDFHGSENEIVLALGPEFYML